MLDFYFYNLYAGLAAEVVIVIGGFIKSKLILSDALGLALLG